MKQIMVYHQQQKQEKNTHIQNDTCFEFMPIYFNKNVT